MEEWLRQGWFPGTTLLPVAEAREKAPDWEHPNRDRAGTVYGTVDYDGI